MEIAEILLVVAAAICLLLRATQVESNRVSFGWLGLFFWACAVLLGLLDSFV